MIQRIIGYFEADVLSLYSSNPHKYAIDTDYFEGELKTSSEYFEELDASGRCDEYICIRFRCHAKSNGSLCVAVFLPDLAKAVKIEQNKWSPFIVEDAELAEPDVRFSMWFDRNFQGSWRVPNGPSKRLTTVI